MRLSGYREILATEATLLAQRNLEAKMDYAFDWMATIRGRVGYAFDRMFVYGTGGVALLKDKEFREQYRSDRAAGNSFRNDHKSGLRGIYRDQADRLDDWWRRGICH